MREALRLAARARGRTAPNPHVGAVVVKAGRRVAGGLHPRAGARHAEAAALAKAGPRARGATLYVTLEPCASWGRTPPCLDAVLASGVRRVVAGMRDSDPRTRGRSLAALRRAGVRVSVGVEEEACRALNRGYLSRVERGRPFTTLKLATSLDGRIATRRGDSRWVTGEQARSFVHALRGRVDAVAVGSGTVLADDPELTARRREIIVHAPTRVVVDSRLRTPLTARLLDPALPGSVLLLARPGAARARRRALEARGARVIEARGRDGYLDLRAAWRALAGLGVNDLLVEGGGGLAAALLRGGLVDRLHLCMGPLLIGGDGVPAFGTLGVERLARAPRPRSTRTRRLGPDLLVTAEW